MGHAGAKHGQYFGYLRTISPQVGGLVVTPFRKCQQVCHGAVIASIVVDLAYAGLDPRVRIS
jgi:hypothetical protein